MPDAALELIASAEDMSFQWLRATLRADNGLKDTLERGHAVIQTPDQLNQYLHTYGPMIESQWKAVAHYFAGVEAPTSLIDYGSGQGIAGLLINDVTNGRLLQALTNVVVIEPSEVAIARADALYRRLAPNATVTAIRKRFDDVDSADVLSGVRGNTLHVFSNSLDIRGFEPMQLFQRTLTAGHHTIISVSQDRGFNGGTPQIEQVKASFEHPSMSSEFIIRESVLGKFTCDNPSQSKGVVWFCKLEVKDG